VAKTSAFFLVFLAATFDEVAHVAAFFFLNDEEGIIFGLGIVAGLFAQINVFDACGFVVVLVVFLHVLEADQLDIGILNVVVFSRCLGAGAAARPGRSPLEGRMAWAIKAVPHLGQVMGSFSRS
jgi:hypothetical protein